MFKGKLIEDPSYYKLKKRIALYSLLPFAILVNFNSMPIWLSVGGFILFFIVTYLTYKTQKELSKTIARNIHIDQNAINILDSKGTQLETITLNPTDLIKLKENYKIPDSVKDTKDEMIGNIKRHFIVLEQDGKEKRFDFEMSSYYMVDRLNKVINLWKEKGHRIEYI